MRKTNPFYVEPMDSLPVNRVRWTSFDDADEHTPQAIFDRDFAGYTHRSDGPLWLEVLETLMRTDGPMMFTDERIRDMAYIQHMTKAFADGDRFIVAKLAFDGGEA